jgi:hypothetical protein
MRSARSRVALVFSPKTSFTVSSEGVPGHSLQFSIFVEPVRTVNRRFKLLWETCFLVFHSSGSLHRLVG